MYKICTKYVQYVCTICMYVCTICMYKALMEFEITFSDLLISKVVRAGERTQDLLAFR
jgi:hypothetical protein